MQSNSPTPIKAYVFLHIAVFLFGFTAILGDLISLREIPLVWWRMGLASLSLLLIPGVLKKLMALGTPKRLKLSGIGIIVALHWLTFFGAIKFSNASVALVVFATTAFQTALIEPLINKHFKWDKLELGLGIIITPAMYLIVSSLDSGMWFGMFLALISALLAAVFSILNKNFIANTPALPMTLMELGSGWLFICLVMPFYFQAYPEQAFWPQNYDFFYLILLAWGCTTIGYVLALKSLEFISAFMANLTVNLEPVYGIIMAAVLLGEHEQLNNHFYIGSAIIISSVFAYPFLKKLFKKRNKQVKINNLAN